MKTHTEPETLYCAIKSCNRKQPFKHKLQLEKHMRRVHRDQLKLNRCENCEMMFATREERREHMRTLHPEVKCDVCLKDYKTPYLMQVHRNSVHVTELNEDGTPLQCSQCNKEFRNYTWLNQHRRRVHSQKKYECDECEYTAQQAQQLKRHQYAAHSENAVRFICHICEKSFLHLNYLKRHFMLRHIEKQK
jgi:PR domain zinc finger protein 5